MIFLNLYVSFFLLLDGLVTMRLRTHLFVYPCLAVNHLNKPIFLSTAVGIEDNTVKLYG